MSRRSRGASGGRRINGYHPLDLHQCESADRAKAFLREELKRLKAGGTLSIMVIHGKGSGSLRRWIAEELWQFLPFTIEVTPVLGNDGCSLIEIGA